MTQGKEGKKIAGLLFGKLDPSALEPHLVLETGTKWEGGVKKAPRETGEGASAEGGAQK